MIRCSSSDYSRNYSSSSSSASSSDSRIDRGELSGTSTDSTPTSKAQDPERVAVFGSAADAQLRTAWFSLGASSFAPLERAAFAIQTKSVPSLPPVLEVVQGTFAGGGRGEGGGLWEGQSWVQARALTGSITFHAVPSKPLQPPSARALPFALAPEAGEKVKIVQRSSAQTSRAKARGTGSGRPFRLLVD